VDELNCKRGRKDKASTAYVRRADNSRAGGGMGEAEGNRHQNFVRTAPTCVWSCEYQ